MQCEYKEDEYKEDGGESCDDAAFHESFKLFDKDGTGKLSRCELRSAIEHLTGYVCTMDHIEALLAEFDKDCSGKIDCPEFQTMTKYLISPPTKEERRNTSANLEDLLEEFGQSFSFDELHAEHTPIRKPKMRRMSGVIQSAVQSSRTDRRDLLRNMASELNQVRDLLCVQDSNLQQHKPVRTSMAIDFDTLLSSSSSTSECKVMDPDFVARFPPCDMRCLALVSHNGMKKTMRKFCESNKNLLKKFRLTGTNSTMTMLEEVFQDEKPGTVVYGPSCQSGPLGGDAELVAHLVNGKIGGIIFFQDPMDSHPHRADIDCLCRQALVHNTVLAETPSTALMLLQTMRNALMGEGQPELIPSFFFSLQSPTVEAYKAQQKSVVNSHKQKKEETKG